ncbi:hypothetical protein BpHYR1_013438 [Brachionus plicatilis]|uniref:Uncharacterized protein n=1 Tax=Brachionus plicatilis TaxID=10195 RepID=A0A3M7SG13_BRAPC|nr:hypothetical protein BpHYR1_013438 [Brachionus plicatilis]
MVLKNICHLTKYSISICRRCGNLKQKFMHQATLYLAIFVITKALNSESVMSFSLPASKSSAISFACSTEIKSSKLDEVIRPSSPGEIVTDLMPKLLSTDLYSPRPTLSKSINLNASRSPSKSGRPTSITQSASAFWKITLRFCFLNGSHFSMKICCGLGGIGGSLSMTTFLAGGGRTLPGTRTSCSPILDGA